MSSFKKACSTANTEMRHNLERQKWQGKDYCLKRKKYGYINEELLEKNLQGKSMDLMKFLLQGRIRISM